MHDAWKEDGNKHHKLVDVPFVVWPYTRKRQAINDLLIKEYSWWGQRPKLLNFGVADYSPS
jgi:hypothetical protein